MTTQYEASIRRDARTVLGTADPLLAIQVVLARRLGATAEIRLGSRDLVDVTFTRGEVGEPGYISAGASAYSPEVAVLLGCIAALATHDPMVREIEERHIAEFMNSDALTFEPL